MPTIEEIKVKFDAEKQRREEFDAEIQRTIAEIQRKESNGSRSASLAEKKKLIRSLGRDGKPSPQIYFGALRALADCSEGRFVSIKELENMTGASSTSSVAAMRVASGLDHVEKKELPSRGASKTYLYALTKEGLDFLPTLEERAHA